MPIITGAPPLPGGANSLIRLYDRVMSAVGNQFSTANFVICRADINAVKSKVSFPVCVQTSESTDLMIVDEGN
jgi:hypothetical protein